MPTRVKGKVYNDETGAHLRSWRLRRKEALLLGKTEMCMLRWTFGVSLRDRKRNENIRCEVGVASIIDKVREARLQWSCGMERRKLQRKLNLKAEVYGKQSRGRQNKRWIDVVQQDRVEWRRWTHAADPLQRDIQPKEKNEIPLMIWTYDNRSRNS